MPGEIKRARTTLQRLQDEVVETAKELNRINGEREQIKAENGARMKKNIDLDAEGVHLINKVNALYKELDSLEEVIQNKHNVVIVIDSLVVVSGNSLNEVNRHMEEVRGKIIALEEQYASVAREMEEKSASKEVMEKSVRDLSSSKHELEQKISSLVSDLESVAKSKEDVDRAIGTALEDFKRFERRIAQFSEDTGYTVGYVRPDTLLNKE